MPTNPDLAALSEAATAEQNRPNSRAYEDAWHTYTHELVRLHRSGDLVLIDREGMRERACFALGGFIPLPPGKTIPDAADAAIAAILGEEKP